MARTDPFDPEGVQWRPVSPKLTIVRVVVSSIWHAIVLIGGVVAAVVVGYPWLWLLVLGWLVFTVIRLVLIPRQVRAWGYAEREDDLLIKHGLFFRVLVVVPYGRLQYVDVKAGPIDRAIGLAQVQLHTASAHSDASIPGLPTEEAARLRDQLASLGEARLAGL